MRSETAILRTAIEQDPALQDSLFDRRDAEGNSTRMAVWNHPGDSVYGLAARSYRVVDTMEQMLGGEVYHYHSKLTAKEPRDGGAWEWHQDYGYWYHNGCPFPFMASVMVALDHSTRENGCLQVLKGSHLAGRVEHGVLPGEQVGANPERVEQLKKHLGTRVCRDGARGRAVLPLERAAPLGPESARTNAAGTVLFCYNAARNNPFLEHHHPFYTPLHKVDDGAVKAAGLRFSAGRETFREASSNPPELSKRVQA